MANPSLQIGNSNWAIKKDNLLGYSTAGTRFLPIPITMTRASAGTRVNPQGLVETVELLGSELVTNGNFENNVLGWNKFKSNATESWNAGGYLDFTKTGVSGRLGSDVSLETNKTYKISVNVKSLGGLLDLYVGLSDFESPFAGVSTSPLVVGTNTFYLTFTGSASSKGVYLQSAGTNYFGLTASINNISVKESTKNDLARVDYTGSTSSLLVEPQRTNEYTESTNIDNWTFSNATGTSNYSVSPDGTQNASRLLFSGSGYAFRGLTQLSGVQYTVSVYAKRNDSATQSFGFFVNGSGAIDSQLNITSEWKRFTYTYTTTNTSETGLAGDSGADISFYGFQKEQGSYATSIIPTSGSAVTRVKDQYSKTGISDKIGQTEGSIYFEFKQNQLQSYTQRLLTLYSDSANLIEIQLGSGNGLVFVSAKTGETEVVIVKTNAITLGSVTKISAGYKAGDFVFYVNGVQAGTDTDSSKTIPQMDNLLFSRYNSTAPFIGSINSLKLYKTRLTNTQLEELTT